MAWFKANDGGPTTAYLTKALALPTEYWFEFDVYIPASTLTACSDRDLFGESADLARLSLGTSFVTRDAIFIADSNYPHGVWKWQTNHSSLAGAFAADVAHTVKAHVNGTTVSWYADGVLLFTYTLTTARDGFSIGDSFSEGCTCEVYFFTNVKVGTTDGGADLFADDFSGGDFSNWTTVHGPAAIAAAPTACAATLALAPNRGCRGDNIFVSGSGYTPNSAITLVVQQSLDAVTFSEATTDASGNLAGYFTIPDGFLTPNFTFVYVVTAGGDVSPLVRLNLCCNIVADSIDSATLIGPEIPISNATPLDYVHADGAHWVLYRDASVSGLATSTLPPPPNHALNLTRISDDGLTVTTYPLDTGYAWKFNDNTFAFLFCNNWQTNLYFDGWDKPVYDAKLATDGTTVWAVVLTAETVLYPFLSSDDGHCGEPSQAAQFVDLATLTSGFTVFPTTPGAGGAPYVRTYHNSIGSLGFYTPDFPNSDGGDHSFGYWNPPRVVVFAGDVGGFSRIGDLDSLYYGGDTSGIGNDGGFVGGPAPRHNEGRQGRFLSGLSVAAAAAEPGVCHVLWAEGGPWGRCGAGPTGGTVATVWDGNEPNQDYRINYTRWNAAGNVFDVDLDHSHIDRTNWWFPFEADPGGTGSTTLYRCGYSWPTTADLAAAAAHALKNQHGSPALVLSAPLTRISPSPIGPLVDSGGNAWLDNEPDFMSAAFGYYDLTTGAAILRQSLDPSLLPTVAELARIYTGPAAPNRLAFGSYASWGGAAALLAKGFSVSLLYDDPTIADTPTYALILPWRNAQYDANENPVGPVAGYPSTGVYRIAADGSRPFEILDGTRLLGFSICLPGYRGGVPPSGDFFSDPKNVWTPGGLNPGFFRQLDRMCSRQWGDPHGFAGSAIAPRATVNQTGLYYDPVADALFYCVWSPDFGGFQIVTVHFCRGCFPCSCSGAAGLHISKRLHFSKS